MITHRDISEVKRLEKAIMETGEKEPFVFSIRPAIIKDAPLILKNLCQRLIRALYFWYKSLLKKGKNYLLAIDTWP